MGLTTESKRFRINPLEVVIFTAIGFVFVRSVVSVVSKPELIEQSFLTAGQTTNTPRRLPASIPMGEHKLEAVPTLEAPCEGPALNEKVTSSFIRLTGMICSGALQMEIMNLTTHQQALINKDPIENKYLSETLMLQPGRNQIQVRLTDPKGMPVRTQEVWVTRE